MATFKTADATFEADVLKSSEPVVRRFWAEWCGPCKMIGPSLEEIATEMQGKVKIAKVNVDENQVFPASSGSARSRHSMLFKDGKVASQKVGAHQRNELVRWINGAI